MKPVINIIQHFLYQAFPLLITAALLSACIHTANQAPIRERQQPPSEKIFQHVVAPGETLFSIAWRYGLDYKRLATVNNIDTRFVIHPGEVLDLRTNSNYSIYQPKQRYSDSKKPSNSTVASTKPSQPQKNAPNRSFSSKLSIASARKKVPSNRPLSTKKYDQPIVWQWPIKGKILNKFSGTQGLNKGIDIKAKKGDKVIAAAAGTVVYAGSGLRGYGKLLIIKHNDIFLSAYGHNSRLRVKEGDVITAGRHIADAGASGTNASKLHFEIRRDGKPINPLHYLPVNTQK